MSNQPTPGIFIELAYNSNAFFSDSQKGDVCIRTANSNQRLLFGVNKDAQATFGMDRSNIIFRGNIAIRGSSNSSQALDVRNGNAYFDSNVYIMNKVSIGSTTPSEYFDVVYGNSKMRSNLYVMNAASIGVTDSNPTETLDIGSNIKVRSNAYVMYRVAIGKSNPNEVLDIEGSAKIANNLYTLQNLSVGTSNPRENVDILANAIVRSNAYVMRRMSVGSSNPTEALDVIGNEKITGKLFVTSNVGLGTSNPSERLDVYDNTKIRGDVYALNKIVIGQSASNPNETLDVRGNTKIGANLYVLSNISVGSSNPSEKVDILGNTKVQGNLYTTTRISVGNSNPTERIDVSGNILASSNVYAMQSIGIGTVFPNERLEVTGNAKVLSNLYVVQKIGVGNSNPEEKVHISGNTKIDQNLYVSSQIGVGRSNPTESVDIIGNLKLSGNIYSMNNLAVGLSNPSEQIETSSNLKVGSNLYVISRLGVATSNPSETTDINGNLKVSSNIYTSNAIVIGGGSNPTEKLDLVGNAKVSSNLYVLSNISVAHSNPTEKVDIYGNLKVSSNIYTSNAIVIGGSSNPTEKLHLVGNAKVTSNLYVLNRLSINSSNPSVGLEVNTTDAVLLAKGTNAQRPSIPVLGHIRYNTDTSQFEGFGAGSAWGSLGGVKSTNQQTYISAEEYPTSNDDIIRFFNSNIESMRITRQRNVGVGTTTPTEKLDISGNVKISNNGYIMGSLGINTSNITEKLQVNTGKIYSDVQILGNSNDSATIPSFSFKEDSNTGIFHASNDTIGFTTAGNEKMRINSNGNIGIGTTTPAYKLDVNGPVNALGYCNLLLDSYSSTSIYNAPTANALKFAADAAIFTSNMIFLSGSNGDVSLANLATSASNTAYWSSNNLVKSSGHTMTGTLVTPYIGVNTSTPTERADITGNLKVSSNIYVANRIGVNTSNPSQAIHVVGDMRIEGTLDVNGILSTVNTDVKLTDQFTVSNNGTGPALKVYQMGAQPVADFFDDTTLAMRIADGGNVGIGTSTPGYKLDVSGTINATGNITGPTITSLSNLGMFSSNTSISASNTVISLSNYVYTTSSTNLTTANAIAISASNTAFWSSNNLIKKSGDVFTGNVGIGASASFPLEITKALSITSNDTTYISSLNALGGSSTFTGVNLHTGDFGTQSLLLYAGGSYTYGRGIIQAKDTLNVRNTPNPLILNPIGGNVGVGIDTPLKTLHVNATGTSSYLRISGDSNQEQGIEYYDSASRWIIYKGANTTSLNFWDGTANRLTLQNGGNIGIGTTSPTAKLDINGSWKSTTGIIVADVNRDITSYDPSYGDYSQFVISTSNNINGQSYIGQMKIGISQSNSASGYIQCIAPWTGVTPLYLQPFGGTVLTGSGNVGIGTASPSYKLDVNGVVNIKAGGLRMVDADDTYIGINATSSAPSLGIIKKSGQLPSFAFTSNQGSLTTANSMNFGMLTGSNLAAVGTCNLTTMMTLTNAGNLGIGLTSPSYRLDVQHTTSSDAVIRVGDSIGSYGRVMLGNSSHGIARGASIGGATDLNDVTVHTLGGTASVTLATQGGEGLRVNSSANVGIGTMSPLTKLDVNGDTTLRGKAIIGNSNYTLNPSLPGILNVYNASSSDSGGTRIWITASNQSHFAIGKHSTVANGDGYVWLPGAYALSFGTTDIERLRIDSSGNVGIGTSNPGYKFDLSGDARITGGLYFGPPTGDAAPVITTRTVPTGQGEAPERTELILFHGNDPANGSGTDTITLRAPGLRFQTYNDASINNITNSNGALDRMYIDPTGNVGIGTSNPGYKLDVLSNININTSTGWGSGLYFASSEERIYKANDAACPGLVAHVNSSSNFSILSTGGNVRMLVQGSTGNVGIGTSTPTTKLDARGTYLIRNTDMEISSKNISVPITDATNVYAQISFSNYASGRIAVTASRVAAGQEMSYYSEYIVNYQSNLTPVIQMVNASSATASMYDINVATWYHDTTTATLSFVIGRRTSGSINFAFQTFGRFPDYTPYKSATLPPGTAITTYSFNFTANGNFGIGTSNPSYKLDVAGGGRINNPVGQSATANMTFENDTNTNKIGMFVNLPPANYNGCVSAGDSAIIAGLGATNTGSLVLGVWGNSNAGIKIDKTGFVGVGTASPAYKLDVSGSLNATTIYQNGTSLSSLISSAGGSYLPLSGGTLTSALTITETTGSAGSATAGTLTLKHNNSGGSSSIVFTSAANAGSDYAYIKYIDQDVSTYFPAQTGVTECSRLTIGIENDTSDVTNSETIVIKGGYGIAYDSGRHFFTGGNVGIGTVSPSAPLQVTPGSSTEPDANGVYVYNSTASTSSHAVVAVRTSGATGGNPFYSWDIASAYGWSMGMSNGDSDKLVIKNNWNFTGDYNVMTFLSSGNVGIGTTNPSQKLEVNGTIKANTVIGTLDGGGNFTQLWSDGAIMCKTSSYLRFGTVDTFGTATGWSEKMRIDTNGNIGIGTSSPGSYRLSVSGEIYASSDITAYSDIRAKSNLEKIINPLDKILQINGYTYEFNTDNTPSQTKITERYSGLVAQEVEKILPEVVHKSEDGKLSIAYGNMAGLFVESIKELKKENTDLKAENQALKSKISDIEDKLTRLETIIKTLQEC